MKTRFLSLAAAAFFLFPPAALAQEAGGASAEHSAATLAEQSSSGSPATTQGTQAAHPPPPHTGWATLLKDTAQDFVAFPMRKSTWVLLGAGAVGAAATHPLDSYVETHIVGNDTAEKVFKPGKVIGATTTQIATAVGLWAIGRYVVPPLSEESRTNRVSHLGFDLLRAQIVSQSIVQGMKHVGQRDRPSGECCSFPSGHAASAFAAAAVLERHLGYRGSWPAMVGATYVATSRLVDGRHFLSDVTFGAALGTAVGWTVVGRHGRKQYALQPIPVPGGVILSVSRVED